MKILLAEDDINLGTILTQLLRKQGINTLWVQDGESAYDKVYTEGFDVLVLDWMMPRLSGIELCKRLRAEDYQGKILMLTARDSIEDRVEGLNMGADDYLVKPFDIAELVARLRALSRRFSSFAGEKFTYNGYVLNEGEYSLSYGDKTITMRNREYKLLEFLLRNHGQILPRGLIIERVWGIDNDISENNLDVHIRMLRKKLAELNGDELICTVRGVGYYVK